MPRTSFYTPGDRMGVASFESRIPNGFLTQRDSIARQHDQQPRPILQLRTETKPEQQGLAAAKRPLCQLLQRHFRHLPGRKSQPPQLSPDLDPDQSTRQVNRQSSGKAKNTTRTPPHSYRGPSGSCLLSPLRQPTLLAADTGFQDRRLWDGTG